MRTGHVGLATLVAALALSANVFAQSKKPPKIITLSGCVERSEKTPDQFTITDPEAGGTYRVSGKDFAEFVGRRVQVDGGVVVKGFAIKGGLQPNANVAAQAGSIDPGRAAVQAATSPSTASAQTPEFRVRTIRPTVGTCQ